LFFVKCLLFNKSWNNRVLNFDSTLKNTIQTINIALKAFIVVAIGKEGDRFCGDELENVPTRNVLS